jgi:glycosyltransferase involved in cell wall biosynthesis
MSVSTSPDTIAYLTNSEKIGGGNQVVMSLVDNLDRARFRPVLVVPRQGAVTEWASAQDVPWSVVALEADGSVLTLLRRVVALARVFRRERASLVHAQSPWSYRAAGLAARLTGTKRVCHLHFPLTTATLDWSVQFGVDAVVTCYEQLARELTASSSKPRPYRLVAIPNTVDITRFTTFSGDDVSARERWRSGADQVVVIVGHLSEVKGYPAFLEAAAQIKARLPRCRFLAVGGETLTPGYGAILKAMTARLELGDAVQFLGWRDDVPEIFRAADVMVLPSLEEGMPLVVLEAMACGLPVVATHVNGIPEEVVDGETGLLVAPKDADGLAQNILALLLDPERGRQMGAAGRRRVEQQFTLPQFVARVEQLYCQVLAT